MGERRRGAGEGSIYRRKDGRWVGQYEVEGKRRYVYGTLRYGGQKESQALRRAYRGLFLGIVRR
jgi:hypothetical protein